MRVGFDLDGVLFDFGQSVREYMDSVGLEYGFEGEPPCWNFFEYWHMTPAEFVQLCNDGADAGFIFRNNVRPNAVEAVQAVKDAGHEIIVITDRSFGTTPKVSEDATREWWAESGFPEFDEIHFSPDKTIVPTDIFVEDKISNFEALWDAGTPCYLVDRPWNTERDTIYRISDVSEYPVKVDTLATVKQLVKEFEVANA
jgi:5'(3')-deoxyribonucleotidase